MSRCGARQSGDLDSSDEALDGILGFGKSNSSMLSQLASTGRVKKMFAHCLDGVNGGGIFVIGHVVEPKVNTTPLVQNQYVFASSVIWMSVMHLICSMYFSFFSVLDHYDAAPKIFGQTR